jgi:NADH dehydrogenase
MARVSTPVQIVIVGAGFAGIETARRLVRLVKGRNTINIVLISTENYFLFQPLLPEVVSSTIELSHIINPIRHLCPHVHYRWGKVEAIDLQKQVLTYLGNDVTKPQHLRYDHLVLCLGQVVGSSSVPGMNEHTLPLKTLGDAFRLRNHVLSRLEQAESTDDQRALQKALTFVTIGGGFSGVETAAAINDMVRTISEYYPKAHASGFRSILVHAGDRILSELDTDLGEFARIKLEGRGVEVRLKTRVAEVTSDRIFTNDGKEIVTGTVISTIGNEQHPLVKQLGLPMVRGRIVVDQCLQVQGFPAVWALGDAAAVPDLEKGGFCPPTAQYAVRQGQQCAQNILASLRGNASVPFRYKGKGQFAVVGKHCGIAQIGRWKVSGLGAWLLWRTVYLSKLPGLRCRVRVAMDWLLDILFPRDITKIEVHRTDVLQRAHFSKGEIIIRQGDPADCFYLIESGQVEIIQEAPDKSPQYVRVCSAGDTFGEVAILRNAPRTATVRCVTAVDVLKFGRQDFLGIFGCKALRSHIQETVERYVT